jgi:chemosensory pili system protein ChpA (sensor histidine kinase/response regulator)
MSRPLAIIAEDDPKLGMIYEMTLHQAGYATFLDKDGDQILDAMPGLDPALIILDMHLPYASGAELLSQIRADERWVNVPIILATADLQAANLLQGKAEYVLAKPVSVGRLLEIINQLQEKNSLTNGTI